MPKIRLPKEIRRETYQKTPPNKHSGKPMDELIRINQELADKLDGLKIGSKEYEKTWSELRLIMDAISHKRGV